MMSFTSNQAGVILTAMNEERSNLEENWLAELSVLKPYDKPYGNVDDDDDTASFYLLDKFKPQEFFADGPKTGNKFMSASTNNRKTEKVVLASEGFHNTLLTTTVDTVDPPEIYKWSVKTQDKPGIPDPDNDGIWNCDTN